ncbi:MAG: type II toxin-antitoxin system VapC family toxin [Hyphomicrobiales bacterium]
MILLDTCAIIYVSQGDAMSQAAMVAIDKAAESGELFVSPISAWEIGSLAARAKLALTTEPGRFFGLFLEKSGSDLCDMDWDILIKSSFLPGPIHKDPMDRIIVASARKHDLTLVTRDRALLAYGAAGYVRTLAC